MGLRDSPAHQAAPGQARWAGAAFLLLLVFLVVSTAPAVAQPAGPESRAGAEAYQDRLIDGGRLLPIESSSDGDKAKSKGAVRSLVVEAGGSIIASRSRLDGFDLRDFNRNQKEGGFTVSGRYQTGSFGMLGLDAQIRYDHGSSRPGDHAKRGIKATITASTREFAMGHGWIADAAAGVSTTPTIPLVRRQARFYLPTMPLLGASASFRGYRPLTVQRQQTIEPEPFASFNLAVGEPGLLGGLRLSEFRRLSGIAASAGGQMELSPQLSSGVQAIVLRGVRDPYAAVLREASTPAARAKMNAEGALATVAYTGDSFRLQANAIWSHRSRTSAEFFGPAGTAGGGWIDASYRTGSSRHTGGAYYFGPGLSWGTSALIQNAYGGYYRFSTSSQRWRLTFNLDAVQSIRGNSAGGIIASADVRRKLNFSTAVGLNGAVRVAEGRTTRQIQGFVDFSSRHGSSRVETGWTQGPSARIARLGINQGWQLPPWLPAGSRLSTQVSYEYRRQTERFFLQPGKRRDRTNSFGVAINAGATPISGVSFDATVSYNSNGRALAGRVYGPVDSVGSAIDALSSEQGRAFSATVMATMRLTSRLSLSASYIDNRSTILSSYGLIDPTTSVLVRSARSDARRALYHLRAGYLTLRFSTSAGRPSGLLGVPQYPVGGSGILEGRVYLDANDDRTPQPSEQGAAGIVVTLDRMHSVRTDQSGHYRFEGVTDGIHQVTVNTDALPLPWQIASAEEADAGGTYSSRVEISVRSTTRLDFPARKE